MSKQLFSFKNDLIDIKHTLDISSVKFSSHIHNDYEFYLFISGDVEYTVENKRYLLNPYDLLVIPPAQYHYATVKSDAIYERIIINFDLSTLNDAFAQRYKTLKTHYKLNAQSKVIETFENMRRVLSKLSDDEAKIMVPHFVTQIIIDLDDVTSLVGEDISPLTNKIINYINDNLTNPLDVKTIANALYISESHLAHIFNKNFHISVMQYVRKKKVLYAQSLIKNGMNATKASEESGFNNYITFYRCYKSVLGLTPEQDYIKQANH